METLALKIYLDDERATPEGWVRVFWPDEAIRLLESSPVEEISLDHDLGDDERGTGYDVVLWIEEAVATRNFVPPRSTQQTLQRAEKWNWALRISTAWLSSIRRTSQRFRERQTLCRRFTFKYNRLYM